LVMNFRRSIISAELYGDMNCKTLKEIDFLRFFGKITPSGKIFKNSIPNGSIETAILTCCIQISWNLADGKSVKSCVIYLTKENKISTGSPALATVRIASKICPGQPQTMYSQCSRFHPNRLTFDGVISECVNTRARSKVNPIFGWSLASSRIKTISQIRTSYFSKTNSKHIKYEPLLLLICCDIFLNQLIQFYSNNATNLHHLTSHITPVDP